MDNPFEKLPDSLKTDLRCIHHEVALALSRQLLGLDEHLSFEDTEDIQRDFEDKLDDIIEAIAGAIVSNRS